LLKELAAEQPVTNIFISPYSAETVLQMVANGAVGKTKTEMQQVLGTTSLSDDSVNQASQRIARSLNTGNTNVILTTAKAIWYRQGTPVRPSFLVLNQQFSDATVAPIDFADPHSVDIINAWAAEKTHGKITHIADGMIDPLYSRLFLANAVYFKGKWLEPFDANDTKERPFHLRDGAEKNVPMMTQSKTFTYRHGTGYQAVRLPYQDENLAMYVFLPETNSRPEKLLSIMSGNTWNRITKPGFSEKEGMLMLPRFKMEYSIEMVKPLKSLGMKLAFDDVNADFSGIASNLYISAVRQKTYIEVKEEGTEAVAATAESVQAGGPEPPRPDPFQMIVDRPFLFLIEDNQTGTILFMGVVFDPRTD
jgi:serpin B